MILNKVILNIRKNISLITIASKYINLKKNGRNFLALCPFHQEKTPSFFIKQSSAFYKCFGCGARGDVLTFLQKITNKSIINIIADLSEKYHLAIPSLNIIVSKNMNKQLQLKQLMLKIQEYFKQSLFNIKNIHIKK